jgi:uncharacterized protein YjbI with pentapeptide repeats
MGKQDHHGEVFEDIDFTADGFLAGEYEECIFTRCQLATVDLSNSKFLDCTFEDCDLGMATLNNVAFQEVRFIQSRLLGLHFEDCNPFLFSVAFHHCQLDLSCFYQCKLSNTLFEKCSLKEADFSHAQLSDAIFDRCQLQGATFDQTLLEGADLSTATGFIIDPENNQIQGAKFSLTGLPGLLSKYNIEVE